MKLKLHWQIIIGIIFAILYGTIVPEHIKYVEWLGILFMRALKMIVVPLVLSSLISGITNMSGEGRLGRIGAKTIIYYMSTSLLAILTGLVLVNTIKPGIGHETLRNIEMGTLDISTKPLIETILEVIPTNIFEALNMNNAMLSVIFIALLTGIFITKLKTDHRKVLTGFFNALFELMMKITLFVIRFAPLGIFGLVAVVIAEHANIRELFSSLGMYMLTVIGGLFFHVLVTLPLILLLFARVNPLKHYKAMATPLITAFTTASSNATLPVTIEAIEDNAGVSNKISSFTLPLGATINMDGTALYELVVAGFIAQIYGVDLTFTQQFIMVTTALLASIGTAAVPMASLVTMTIIFSAVGLPFEAVALILPVDRPLDMLRTATNVFSDSCGAVIIAKSEGEKLKI